MQQHLPLVLVAIALVAGCTRYAGRTDINDGIAMHPDGRMLRQTDDNMRQVHQARMAEDIAGLVDRPWDSIEVAILQKPMFDQAADPDRDNGDWVYDQATVVVTVAPDFPLADQAIVAAARDFLLPGRMRWPHRDLEQRIAISVARQEAASAPVAETPAPAAADAQRRYVVQAGDTLADISAAFYGSSQHWRRILDANPGLSPDLEPGTEILVPPRD